MTTPRPDAETGGQLHAIRVVAELSASPMSVVSGSGELLVANEAYCRMVGRSREELATSGLRGITHPADYERDRGAMQALAQGHLPSYTTEKRYVWPDGSIVWGIVTATPVRSEDAFVGSFSVIQNITDRKRAEDALRDSEEHFRQVLGAAPIGMGLLDRQGRWVMVNQALCDITGLSEAEMFGRSYAEMTHPDDLDEDPEEFAQLLSGRVRSDSVRKRYVRPSGEVIWIRSHRSLLTNADGTPQYVIGQVEDITADVEAEQDLQASADRLRRLAEGAKDFVVFRWRFFPEPGFEYVSPGALNLTGYSAEEFCADPTLGYRVLHPDDVAAVEQMSDPDNTDFGPHALRVVHRDGHLLYTEQRIVPITDEDGRFAGFDAILIDITARVEAERQVTSRERRFRSLVQNSSDMVFIADADGVLVDATPSVERVLGYAPAKIVGRNRLDFFHPNDVAAAAETFTSEMQAGTSATVEYRVRDADGQWRWLECMATNLLEDPDVRGMVLNARDVTERHALHSELQRRADYDPLTGLINWRRFMEVLVERTEGGASEDPLGVLVLGLNRFGAINDTLGYHYGDRLLQQVARRLHEFGNDTTVVARGGGKRFAVLFPTQGYEALSATAESVLSVFDETFDIAGQPVQVDATGGTALYPSDGGEPELLLRRAEVARRRARMMGVSVGRYTAGQAATGAGQIRFLGQLREAIDDGQLLLHYQPKIDVTSRVVDGVEALVRWQHPTEGWVQPAQFIPLAEESGLIGPLTQWVVRTALDQGRRWRREGLPLQTAVNVTARNLQDPHFVDMIAAALEDHGAEPADLCLEITERSVMTDPPSAAETCRRLSALGVRLSLDDFGTGHSALAYLVRLPIDEIKIDRTFVEAIRAQREARAIVHAIVALASDLDKDVIAEGVEDDATARLLVSLGCSRMQGYLYSRPVPVEAVGPWLASGSWSVAQPPGQ